MKSIIDKFTQFLVDQTPKYDEEILSQMYGTYVEPISIDRRLLPNKFRTILRLRDDKRLSFKQIGRKLRITYQSASSRYRKGTTLLNSRFEQWISIQPKNKRVSEEKLRTKKITNPWLGLVKTAKYPHIPTP